MSERKIPKVILWRDRDETYFVVDDDNAEGDSESTYTPNQPEYNAVKNNDTTNRLRQVAPQGGIQAGEDFTR